jgi:hypothetical protein
MQACCGFHVLKQEEVNLYGNLDALSMAAAFLP